MRIAPVLIATAFMLVVLPLTAQATSTCSDCPDLVDQSTDISATVSVVPASVAPISATSSRREARQNLIDRRRMMVLSALSGSNSNGNPPPDDLGGDGGSMGGGDGGVVPEPATGLMTALGLLGIAIGRRRRA